MTGSAAPERVRVAAVSVSAALGGSEWSLLEFARRAGTCGVDLTVLLPREGPLTEALRREGVAVALAPAEPELLELSQREMITAMGLRTLQRGLRGWAKSIAATAAALPGGMPPVLYSNGFKAHLACALVRGPRRVWHLREFPPDLTGLVWRLLAGFLPHATIANSDAVARAWKLGGLTPTPILNGVDLERFAATAPTRWIHEQLALPAEAVLVGMPAVFARWKGQLLVIDAFERAAARLPHAHLVLVGGAIYDTVAERGYAEELVRRVKQAGPLQGRIHFLKHQAEPWRLYPEFAAVVHFSTRPEPFGRVIAEAMACAVPVIAARAGGPMELVEHGVTGWLVAPNDVDALADAMVVTLAADLGTMGRAARARAQRLCDAPRYAEAVAGVLRAEAAR